MNHRLDSGWENATQNGEDVAPIADASARTIRDESYRRILGANAWNNLAPEVRARFSIKPRVGRSIRYRGTMNTVELSLFGWIFAQFCRLIGTPLAPIRGRDVPMLIALSPDKYLPGIVWSRRYEFPGRRTVTVKSTKCHTRGGHFVEYIGRGFSMRLKLCVKKRGPGISQCRLFLRGIRATCPYPRLVDTWNHHCHAYTATGRLFPFYVDRQASSTWDNYFSRRRILFGS